MDTMTGLQPPLAPLYQPNERFEISAAGLDDWQRSESFKRTTVFYLSYPARSLLSHASRAVLHHLIVMKRPHLALEIGTYQAGTSEVIELLTGPARTILDRWFESTELKSTLATDAIIGAMASPSTPGTDRQPSS